jgi:hypothetical protein
VGALLAHAEQVVTARVGDEKLAAGRVDGNGFVSTPPGSVLPSGLFSAS